MSDDWVPAPGMISKKLVAECHRALMDIVDEGGRLFFELRDRPNVEWKGWCLAQPSKQRSYLRTIRSDGQTAAFAAYINARDHVLLLADSFDEPKNSLRIWSYLSLARAACEAFIRVAVLSDRSTDLERHLLLNAATLLDGDHEQVLLARDVAPEVEPITQGKLDADLKRCERAGIEAAMHRGRVQRVSRNGMTVNASIDVTGETGTRIKAVPGPYRFGSAVAHSGAWFLASAMGDDGEFGPRADPDIIVVATMMTAYAHVAAVESVATAVDADKVHAYRARVDRQTEAVLRIRRQDHRAAR